MFTQPHDDGAGEALRPGGRSSLAPAVNGDCVGAIPEHRGYISRCRVTISRTAPLSRMNAPTMNAIANVCVSNPPNTTATYERIAPTVRLEERLAAAQPKPEWRVLLADPDRLQEIAVEQDGKHFILRTPATGVAGKVFQAIGVALPPNIRDAAPQPSP